MTTAPKRYAGEHSTNLELSKEITAKKLKIVAEDRLQTTGEEGFYWCGRQTVDTALQIQQIDDNVIFRNVESTVIMDNKR
jgi:hypothetical protein